MTVHWGSRRRLPWSNLQRSASCFWPGTQQPPIQSENFTFYSFSVSMEASKVNVFFISDKNTYSNFFMWKSREMESIFQIKFNVNHINIYRGFKEEVKEDDNFLKFGHLKNSDNFLGDRPTYRQTDRLTDIQTLWFIGKLHFQIWNTFPEIIYYIYGHVKLLAEIND